MSPSRQRIEGGWEGGREGGKQTNSAVEEWLELGLRKKLCKGPPAEKSEQKISLITIIDEWREGCKLVLVRLGVQRRKE